MGLRISPRSWRDISFQRQDDLSTFGAVRAKSARWTSPKDVGLRMIWRKFFSVAGDPQGQIIPLFASTVVVSAPPGHTNSSSVVDASLTHNELGL